MRCVQGAATVVFALVAPLGSETGSRRRSLRGSTSGIKSGSLLVDCKVRRGSLLCTLAPRLQVVLGLRRWLAVCGQLQRRPLVGPCSSLSGAAHNSSPVFPVGRSTTRLRCMVAATRPNG